MTWAIVTRFISVAAAAAISLPACGAVRIRQGTASLWGRATTFTAWELSGDGVDLTGSSVRPSDLVVYNGKLFVANWALAGYAPGFAYETGATGDLSTPIGKSSTGLTSIDNFAQIRTLAINTSGIGLGAFSGPDPTLVGLGRVGQAPDSTFVFRDQGAKYATTKAAWTVAPHELDFVPSLGKFATIARVATDGTNRVSFWSHDATGLSAVPERSFDFLGLGTPGGVSSYGTSMSVISGSLAAFLTGIPISQAEVLLIAGAPGDQFLGLDDLTLAVFDLNGNRLGSGLVIRDTGVHRVTSIAVDEQNGLLYVGGDQEGGGPAISVVTIPAPGVPAICGLTCMLLGARRRQSRS